MRSLDSHGSYRSPFAQRTLPYALNEDGLHPSLENPQRQPNSPPQAPAGARTLPYALLSATDRDTPTPDTGLLSLCRPGSSGCLQKTVAGGQNIGGLQPPSRAFRDGSRSERNRRT
jgi:hypothetical protein